MKKDRQSASHLRRGTVILVGTLVLLFLLVARPHQSGNAGGSQPVSDVHGKKANAGAGAEEVRFEKAHQKETAKLESDRIVPETESKSKPSAFKGVYEDSWLEKKRLEEGVFTLPDGLMFRYLSLGHGKKSPRVSDPCEVHYEGRFTNGNVFDSSFIRRKPAVFKPSGVIAGWTEALQLMREGDEWEVYLPYNLAYGERGYPPTIPGKATLVFTIQLLAVQGDGKGAEVAQANLQQSVGATLQMMTSHLRNGTAAVHD
jgi:FKBP-type peptidyl-prolyl cis-trans isomerase FklB